SQTGAAVTAFSVLVLPHDGTPPIPRADDDATRTENFTPVVSAAGLFKTESKAGHWDVVVRAAGYLPAAAEDVVVPPVDTRALAIVVSHGPSITGLVYGDDGLPVPDVPVFLSAEKLVTPGDLGATVARTGGDGRFRFSPLPAGTFAVTALEPRNDV